MRAASHLGQAVVASTLVAGVAPAEEFNWVWYCVTPYWSTTCNDGPCGEGKTLYANNWGKKSCGSSPAFPGPNDFAMVGGGLYVFLDTHASIYGLALGARLLLRNGTRLTVSEGGIQEGLNSVIELDGAGVGPLREVDGDVRLSGGGTVTLTGIGSSGIRGATATDRLINENTIEGAGDVGSNPMALTNRGLGLIDANDPA